MKKVLGLGLLALVAAIGLKVACTDKKDAGLTKTPAPKSANGEMPTPNQPEPVVPGTGESGS